MTVLGIEGTAHTLGVGIVEERGGRCHVLANQRRMVRPDQGGIHPREAAHQHAEQGPLLLAGALAQAGIGLPDLDGVAFSQGPGLGPCLRVAATMARAVAARHGIPLAGVNHCVAHLEVARGVTGARDPLLLYASGANTQVLAFVRGRYRVVGETLDVGVGNALDKFARDQGIPFPGGPEVERLALEAGGDLLPLPYSVKGMDMSFSGLVTSAQRAVTDGFPLADVCHSLQEHAFAALVETAERGLAHTGKVELALGGGVACNARLQQMARQMAGARGVAFAVPPRDLLVDNGAMIAWLGLLQLRAGAQVAVADSQVHPYQRTDAVEAIWRTEADGTAGDGGRSASGILKGAEAELVPARYLERAALVKRRVPKAYRHPALDARLRAERTREEARLLVHARRGGVPVPVLLDADLDGAALWLEHLEGTTLREHLRGLEIAKACALLGRLGTLTANLHASGATHGDLTTANVMVTADGSRMALIDFGLGQSTAESEPRGVDLHLVEEALAATEPAATQLMSAFLDGYRSGASWRGGAEALQRLDEIRERGRYR